MKRTSAFALVSLVAGAIFLIPATSRSMSSQSRFKNIKVLNSLSDADINREMQSWNKALGVACTHCHEGSNYSSDENPKKEIARKMFTMLTTVNKDFLDGKASCVLCHRGSAVPDTSK